MKVFWTRLGCWLSIVASQSVVTAYLDTLVQAIQCDANRLNIVRLSFRNFQQLSSVAYAFLSLQCERQWQVTQHAGTEKCRLAFNLQYLFLGKSLWAPALAYWPLRLQQMNLYSYVSIRWIDIIRTTERSLIVFADPNLVTTFTSSKWASLIHFSLLKWRTTKAAIREAH